MKRNLIPALLLLTGCQYIPLPPTEKLTVSMRWECALPDHFEVSDFVRQDPAAKPVTLHFARYPGMVQIEAQPGLCDALKAAGKPVVPAIIAPLRQSNGHIDGYNLLSVDGYAVGSPYSQGNGNLAGGRAPSLEDLLR